MTQFNFQTWLRCLIKYFLCLVKLVLVGVGVVIILLLLYILMAIVMHPRGHGPYIEDELKPEEFQRIRDVHQIVGALWHYSVDNGGVPPEVMKPRKKLEVCVIDNSKCEGIDLSFLSGDYLQHIPIDPEYCQSKEFDEESSRTGYYVKLNKDGTITGFANKGKYKFSHTTQHSIFEYRKPQ